ncbi:hypothetical protein OBBRIDRAFT_668393 [Obba rivulosa]|uniref:Protein kinase domain-containing protein n=1 Tax=Obba rivulosa TaxID=1052685 RepID=A0A8E2AW34_9APHY|nr:hypothetical protein OBBRIDRAFT_668393 [Obba rivulosa]
MDPRNNSSAAKGSPPMSPQRSSPSSITPFTGARDHSPLNPASNDTTPKLGVTPLPSTDGPASPGACPPIVVSRLRGLSTSTIRPDTTAGLTRVVSSPAGPAPSLAASIHSLDADVQSLYSPRIRASSLPHGASSFDASATADTRARSRSPFRHPAFTWRQRPERAQTPPNGVPVTWWTSNETETRPWFAVERRQRTVPQEQTEGWVRTRQKVAQASSSVLGTALDVTHEALTVGVELVQFAPVLGLQEVARALLGIWDSLQAVDLNRMACLRLTERCATVLISVREEVAESGDQVGEELRQPIMRLIEAFAQVHCFLQKQNHRPFLKRYLKRDEIRRALRGCDDALDDALGMFNLSIQIRILKQVLKAEEQRQADSRALIERLMRTPSGAALLGEPLPSAASPVRQLPEPVHNLAIPFPSSPETLPLPAAVSGLPLSDLGSSATSEQIRTALRTLSAEQDAHDTAHDTADLRALLRGALQANNDVALLKVLQVSRDEMPEAIKTLQRALEREVEKEHREEDEAVPAVAAEPQADVSVAETVVGASEGTQTVERAALVRAQTSNSSRSSASRRTRDTLDREFMETGIDALRRLSGLEVSLPSWTITRYEVDREEKIGIGFFSDVYRGTWRGKTVAIKVLAETTPRQLFVHEVEIWKSLQHPNVLGLLGASSASSDPPWFFVSPYLKNGSLPSYLRGTPSLDGIDLLRMIHEIARGMAYLHGRGVLHGDLKGANVLIDDRGHCIISDFGQSEMRSEAYRISGTDLPHGTLRWQAPELMSGQSELTHEVDVYAFAICCIEVLTKGSIPWPLADDDAVRHFVLNENMRPQVPLMRSWSLQLSDLLNRYWHRDPAHRPPFAQIEHDLRQLRAQYGSDLRDSPRPPIATAISDEFETRKSPDMRPRPDLPTLPPDTTQISFGSLETSSSEVSYETAHGEISPAHSSLPSQEVHITSPSASPLGSSRMSMVSLFDSIDSQSEDGFPLESGYESPPPADAHLEETRNERRYRMLLQHEFHPSLTLPLWCPSPVALGAVGYHEKPSGKFVTLFNSFRPGETSGGVASDIPSLFGYGPVTTGNQPQNKRNVAQRGMDMIQQWLGVRSNGRSVSRRYSSPLRAGHKAAHLFTEATVYRYVEDLATPKKWFNANVDRILELYGAKHQISREDLYLVIGTLDAQDHALFVSHSHPDSQVNFDVYSAPQKGEPWGQLTTTDLAASIGSGPIYHEEPAGGAQNTSKISSFSGRTPWDTVLIARLRFKPDAAEPTSL